MARPRPSRPTVGARNRLPCLVDGLDLSIREVLVEEEDVVDPADEGKVEVGIAADQCERFTRARQRSAKRAGREAVDGERAMPAVAS